MNFYAIVIIGNQLFVGGPYGADDCQAQLSAINSDATLTAYSPDTTCVPEKDLPRVADMARSNECVFKTRAELASGAHIVAFVCNPKQPT